MLLFIVKLLVYFLCQFVEPPDELKFSLESFRAFSLVCIVICLKHRSQKRLSALEWKLLTIGFLVEVQDGSKSVYVIFEHLFV